MHPKQTDYLESWPFEVREMASGPSLLHAVVAERDLRLPALIRCDIHPNAAIVLVALELHYRGYATPMGQYRSSVGTK